MQCKRHHNEVVAICAECGAGVCDTCTEATASLHEECGTLCIPCYVREMNNAITWYETKRSKALKNIIISCVLYAMGAMMILLGMSESPANYPMALVGVFFCGFYSAISGWKKAESAHDEYEYKHGASYTITDDGIYRNTGFFWKLLTAAIFTVIGVIATPINVIRNIIGRARDQETVESLIYEIERVKKI